MTYHKRELAGVVAASLRALPVVVVTGPRQAGKSTLILHQTPFRGRAYVSLDSLAELERARRDPEGFVRGRGPLAVDEAQRCPELLLAVKREVDRRRAPGRFLLSGSANFALLKAVTESLAGRAIYHELAPMHRRELHGDVGARPVLSALLDGEGPDPTARARAIGPDEILAGGFPPAALGPAGARDPWFEGFVQTYVERDVRHLSQVADLVAFQRVLRLAALRSASILSTAELSRDAAVPVATTGRYLGLLQTSYLLRMIPPFLGNRSSRLVKSPKVYLTDAGLACHLGGIRDAAALRRSSLAGALLETYTVQNLAALLAVHRPRASLLYWNVQGRHEVDFVIEEDDRCVAIEVKAATRWKEADVGGLTAFLRATPRCRAAILAYNGTEAARVRDGIWAIPLGLLLA